MFVKSKEIEAIEAAFECYYSMQISGEELMTRIKRVVNEVKNEVFDLQGKVADKEEIIGKLNQRLSMIANGKKDA